MGLLAKLIEFRVHSSNIAWACRGQLPHHVATLGCPRRFISAIYPSREVIARRILEFEHARVSVFWVWPPGAWRKNMGDVPPRRQTSRSATAARKKSLASTLKKAGLKEGSPSCVVMVKVDDVEEPVTLSWNFSFQHTFSWAEYITYKLPDGTVGRVPPGVCNLYTYPVVKFRAQATIPLAMTGNNAKRMKRRVEGDPIDGPELAIMDEVPLLAGLARPVAPLETEL